MKTPEMPRYVPIPGPDLNVPYQTLYVEPTPAKNDWPLERKQELLGEDLEKIKVLFAENGIPLPANPLDRIKFLGFLPYYKLRRKLSPKEKDYDTLGFTVNDNALAYVSIFDCEWDAEYSSVSARDSLRRTSIHELLHCLNVREWWMSTDPDDHRYISNRREGITTSRPVTDSKGNASYVGGWRLNEGVVTYITQQITNADSPESLKRFYPGETEITQYLIEHIGLEPLLRAMFTKQGLRELNAKMKKSFGNKSLREMLEYMGVEHTDNDLKNEVKKDGEKRELYYPRTLEYLRLTSDITLNTRFLKMLDQCTSSGVAENFQK